MKNINETQLQNDGLNCDIVNASFIDRRIQMAEIIITKENFDENLLLAHLKLNLKDVIENCVEQLSIDFQGNAQTFTEIKDFFKVN